MADDSHGVRTGKDRDTIEQVQKNVNRRNGATILLRHNHASVAPKLIDSDSWATIVLNLSLDCGKFSK